MKQTTCMKNKEPKKYNKEKKVKYTKFKAWLMENGITQNYLANKTSLSTNTINRLVNGGGATDSVLKLVAHEVGLNFEELKTLLFEHNPAEAK